MLAAIKKLVGRRFASAPPIECVFPLDANRRTLYLLDLATILRLPDARIALPEVAHLERTIRRNRARIRIPRDAMLGLVRELQTVRHRIPAGSPLHDIMQAIPGLVHGVFSDSPPPSSTIGGTAAANRIPPISRAEQEAEVARIRNLIAHNKQPAAPIVARPATRNLPTGARRHGPVYAAPREPVAGADASRMPEIQGMSDQGREPGCDAELFAPAALSTRALADNEFAAYVDVCIVNGDHQHVIAMLAERVVERPRAWAWSRLLELAEAAGDARFNDFRARFVRWTAQQHPHLIQAAPADDESAMFYGIPRAALQQMGRAEMTPRNHL